MDQGGPTGGFAKGLTELLIGKYTKDLTVFRRQLGPAPLSLIFHKGPGLQPGHLVPGY